MEESALPQICIRRATTAHDLARTRELFTAYADSLPISLGFQNFTAELASLPGLYAPPTGAIFLAYLTTSSNDPECQVPEPIGVVALRPLPKTPAKSKICEMKRLYLCPASRGLGIGKRLVDEVVKEARQLGYAEMKMDTLATMIGPRALYKKAGFVEVEQYYDTPIEGTIFLSKSLRDTSD